jgi:hypothetical protein
MVIVIAIITLAITIIRLTDTKLLFEQQFVIAIIETGTETKIETNAGQSAKTV